ncbi:Tectonin beta-propeller repeat-containing protein 1 [Bulinus truncatus]|nr:Tectonin beta-propeller repeat-containing protein 1 [Bulinus truncatus]
MKYTQKKNLHSEKQICLQLSISSAFKPHSLKCFLSRRWNPLNNSFSKNGLWRTDRYAWSDETGVLDRPKENFRLPSSNWEWEGDWLIDENLHGEVISREGWQYAVDFPREYFPEKHWNSFVRRRKWIRFRRFSSTNKWAKITDQEVVKSDRFIDLSIGGFSLPNQPSGFLSVWTITQTGKVFVRTNVHYCNPEGDTWQQLDIPESKSLINISVGATNLVWGISYEGQAVVRMEITINNTFGTRWKFVEFPDDKTRFAQVSVGRNSVWALSRDGQVWFRKGTCGDDIFWNERSAVGTSWVQMVGQMSHITVSSNDQVFAIDISCKVVYFRTSITRTDLTGKTWQPINLIEDFTSLLRQGLVCAGDVCYCGDPANVCNLHGSKQHRTPSTTSSCSNSSSAFPEDSSVEKLYKPVHSSAVPPVWQSLHFQLNPTDQVHSSMPGSSDKPCFAPDDDFVSAGMSFDGCATTNHHVPLNFYTSQCNCNHGAASLSQDSSLNNSVIEQTDVNETSCSWFSQKLVSASSAETATVENHHHKKTQATLDQTDYGIPTAIQSTDPTSLFYHDSHTFYSICDSASTAADSKGGTVSGVSYHDATNDTSVHNINITLCDSGVRKHGEHNSNTLENPIILDQHISDMDHCFSSIDSDETIDFVTYAGSDAENCYSTNDNHSENKNAPEKDDGSVLVTNFLDEPETGSGDDLFTRIIKTDSQPSYCLSNEKVEQFVNASEEGSSFSSDLSTNEVRSAKTLTLAQPRLCWKWVDATSCVIDDSSSVEWLTTKEAECSKKIATISQSLRNIILKKLLERNQREVQNFKNIDCAINRTTWVKKAKMQMYHYSRDNYWLPCNIEFEQGINNITEGCLTVHHQYRKSQKHVQIPLSEMTCVKMVSDPDLTTCFLVYTSMTNLLHQPLMLRASSESEAEEWIGYFCAANAKHWNLNSPVEPGSVWSCTFTGDVFIAPADVTNKKPFDICWGHHGGHMAFVETGPSGVTWGVGFDKMPYVYNRGFGGAVTCGSISTSDNVQQIIDTYHVYVYESQKSYLLFGWRHKSVLGGDFHWMTESGRKVTCKEDVKLPSSKWHWTSDWAIDFNVLGGVDANGWQYSKHFDGPFHRHQQIGEHYRRRRWIRKCKINLYGPWETAGSLGLIDLSIQIDPVKTENDPIVMWAVGANGDVLYRQGVTTDNPLGVCWIHVATDLDKPFKSISVGGRYRVWGIASDGSAWYRSGVSPKHPAGNVWLQVVPPPPVNHLLHQVSAGATSVWAVDTGDNLWRRKNITSTFPEGTEWEHVASRVKRVSVGPKDQVWIVTDANFCKAKHGPGVIYNRVGITDEKPSGSDWEVVIGNGWAQVSVRGVCDSIQNSPSFIDESWD